MTLQFRDRRDGDGGDEGREAFQLGVALGQDADGGQVIFTELLGQVPEPPAKDHHVSVAALFLSVLPAKLASY